MKIERLRAQNFLTIGEADLRLDDRGLVLLQGVNLDDTSAKSNGAGKSSIADAVCWCLYGVTAREVTGDSVVLRSEGKGCVVELTLLDGDDRWIVRRHRKHKTGRNALHLFKVEDTGAETDHTKGTDKLTQAALEKVVGCSYEVFRSAVYAGQESMPNLPGMTDKPLKLLVEEAAGITVLEGAYEVARKRAATAGEHLAREVAAAERLTDRLKTAADQIAEAERDKLAWDADTVATLRTLAGEAKLVKDGLPAQEALVAGYCEEKLVDQIKAAEAALAAVEGERRQEQTLANAVGVEDREVVAHQTAVTRFKADIERAKKDLDRVGSRVGDPCGECGKAYCEHDLAAAKKLATDKLARIVADCRAAIASFGDAQKRAQSARETLSAHRASMTDVSATSALLRDLRAKYDELGRVKAELTRQRSKLTDLVGRIKERRETVNPHLARIERAKLAHAELEKGLEAAKAAHAAAEEEVALVTEAMKVFGPAGVRAHILDTVTPFLNDRTAHYLGTLSDGNITATWSTLTRSAKGELKEKFAIEVNHAKGGDQFAAISGGEKRKVRAACALALQDLVSSRATKPFGLFIGDEIDDALDAAGLERLIAVLEEKARDRGTVLIISHSDLKDWIRQSITITKSGDRSTVSDIVAA